MMAKTNSETQQQKHFQGKQINKFSEITNDNHYPTLKEHNFKVKLNKRFP